MMNSTQTLSKRGFTLIEMAVYLGILIFVSTASVALLLSLNGLIGQYRIETALYRSGTNTLEQIIVELRRANQLDVVNTTVNDSTAGQVSLVNGTTTTKFAKVGNELQMTINGVNKGDMTDDTTTVTGFTVYRYDTAVGTLIRVRLRLSATIGSVTKDTDLYGAAIIRGAL